MDGMFQLRKQAENRPLFHLKAPELLDGDVGTEQADRSMPADVFALGMVGAAISVYGLHPNNEPLLRPYW